MSAPSVKPARPLSPHLQVYRPQLTSMLSILHRATGVGLALGMPVFVAWLVVIAADDEFYNTVIGWLSSPVGQVLLFGWSWALFYHFCTGIRHLFWDAGLFLDIKNVYRTGWLAVGISALVTAYVWGWVITDWKSAGIIFLEFIGALVVLGIVAGFFLWLSSMFMPDAKKKPSMRAPLAKVRGLGAAKGGTHHWWLQRVTALALIPILIYTLYTFFGGKVYTSHQLCIVWLSHPFAAVAMILFLVAGFHHAASGLQVVIEDYVHCEASKLASILSIKFLSVALALLGSLAVLRILFFFIVAMVSQSNAHPPQ